MTQNMGGKDLPTFEPSRIVLEERSAFVVASRSENGSVTEATMLPWKEKLRWADVQEATLPTDPHLPHLMHARLLCRTLSNQGRKLTRIIGDGSFYDEVAGVRYCHQMGLNVLSSKVNHQVQMRIW